MMGSPDFGEALGRSGAPPPLLWLVFPAEAPAVRTALLSVERCLAEAGIDLIDQATVELVLAEVLNNVAEHAYDGSAPGEVGLSLTLAGAALACRVSDGGRRFPGGRPPSPGRKPPDPGALPEGGFGWSLIHALTRRLDYRHAEGRNLLSFDIPLAGGTDTLTD
jgi:serine/threonine-protein kinase RsbW